MAATHPMHLTDHEITDPVILDEILRQGKWTTLALAYLDEGLPRPYALTLSYGYVPEERALYFHTALGGQKFEILAENPLVCGTVVHDLGYVQGKCSHPFRSVVFWGRVEELTGIEDKRRGLDNMIAHLEDDPELVRQRLRARNETYARTRILKLTIEAMTGKEGK